LLLWGGRYLPSIAFGGQGYRWITSLVIHQSIMHILSNMVLFLILSGYLEHQYGTMRILVIFVISETFYTFFETSGSWIVEREALIIVVPLLLFWAVSIHF
jgi:membrane associated rhomboid family serine protease